MQEHLFMLYTPTNAMPEGVGGGGGGVRVHRMWWGLLCCFSSLGIFISFQIMCFCPFEHKISM